LKTHTNNNVTQATASDFQDWDKFLNSQYKLLDSGETNKKHIFTAERENKTLLLQQIDALPETQTTTQDMLKKGTNIPQQFHLLRLLPLEMIIPPGIPSIKQVVQTSKITSNKRETQNNVSKKNENGNLKNGSKCNADGRSNNLTYVYDPHSEREDKDSQRDSGKQWGQQQQQNKNS
jgi:hypothetical protein